METTNVAVQVLDELGKKFGLMVDWSQQNIQPYIQDLMSRVVKYELLTSVVWLVVWLLLLSVGVFLFVKFCKSDNDIDEILLLSIPFGFCTLIFFIGFMWQITDIIKCISIPEMVFVYYIQSLVA